MRKADSELQFVDTQLYIISILQTTHQDSVKKSGLLRIFFDKSCLRRNLYRRKIWPTAHFLQGKFSSELLWDAFDFKFVILSTNSLLAKTIQTPIRRDHIVTAVE